MVALENYKPFFRSPSASTIGFQFCSEVSKVNALCIYSLDNCRRFSPLSCFQADLHKLLFHADCAADTQVFWKPTGGAYFRHYFDLMLLYSYFAYRPKEYLTLTSAGGECEEID